MMQRKKLINNQELNAMKKIVIIPMVLAAILAVSNSFAQVSLGAQGSFNMFNLAMKDVDGKKVDAKMIPTFDVGIFAELPLADEFFIRPELLFASKGAKSKNVNPGSTIHLSYVEVPVLFLYKGALSNNKVLLGFGPYLALGIGGKAKTGSIDIDVKFKSDVKKTDGVAAYYTPLDIGGQLMAGYELESGLSVAINASLGLVNIEPKFEGAKPDASTKNVGFGLSLGYRFGKK
jgi:hypothetical protein